MCLVLGVDYRCVQCTKEYQYVLVRACDLRQMETYLHTLTFGQPLIILLLKLRMVSGFLLGIFFRILKMGGDE